MGPINLDSAHGAPLAPLADLLWKWNRAHNLFSRRLSREQLDHLLLECLAFDGFLPPDQRVADLGSGAGLPGLPLALLRPDLKISLVEPRAKRCTWLRYAAQTLNLDLQVIEGHWDPAWDHYDRVVSRAVFPPDTFLESVGNLAPWSLQMTGPSAKPDDNRRAIEVRLGGEARGLILASEGCVSPGV